MDKIVPMQRATLFVLLGAGILAARDRVGTIDFYGCRGIDVEAVRRALPFHTGDPYTAQTKPQARETVQRVVGRPATDVEAICCDQNGDRSVFIGLPGESSKRFPYQPTPTGAIRLAKELWDLEKQIETAKHAAVSAGRAEEDRSEGYALSKDQEVRALELKLRAYVLQHEKEVYAILESSSDNKHREYAANALGYGRQSPQQITALLRASSDSNDGVRDEAVRALGCLTEKPEMRALISPDLFVGMMNSGVWTDRNKASVLLAALTESRDRKLMARLRAEAIDAIIEMARWHDEGHALTGVWIFAHLAGASDEKVLDAAHLSAQAMLALLPGQ
jgi:hypothetical protein